MFFWSKEVQQQYDRVLDNEVDGCSIEKQSSRCNESLSKNRLRTLGVICAFIFATITAFFVGYTLSTSNRNYYTTTKGLNTTATSNCTNPSYRREWRSLSTDEKKEYLRAFQCFVDTPSRMGLNGSLYDDFSWVHNLVAHNTHTKAPFLTWHRRFIFVYEQTLQQTCGYKGNLPYWDWSLDWEDPPNSPIFDSTLGFGGDGDLKAPVHHGSHCVTDLPFEKGLTPKWYGEQYFPHCLVRNFEEDWFGHYMNPEKLTEIMASTTYADFFYALEMGPHDIIPMGVRGDFTSFTAPNDPVFYLHHSQLDRIWYLWQLRDKENRVASYGGLANGGANVTLNDVIPLAGLAKDVKVKDIMDTEAEELCYRYMTS